MALASGDRLGRYVILEPLGAGGMGAVYRARQRDDGLPVAVKVLLGRGPSASPAREIRAMAEKAVVCAFQSRSVRNETPSSSMPPRSKVSFRITSRSAAANGSD